MTRYEVWRLAYRRNRYCEHLAQPELNKRIRDIFLVLLTLTPEGKIGVMPMNLQGSRWMELWTHVLEEMVLRFGPYPAGFSREILHSEPFPKFVGPLAARAASALARLSEHDVLIKFGKPNFMRALFERGALRVQPASFFKKPDHNGAVRDDELALDVSLVLRRENIVKLVSNPADVPDEIPLHRMDVRYESPADYWLYCLTTAVQPRTFVDFEAEACVVIKNRSRFIGALLKAIAPHTEGATVKHGSIQYVDPLLPETAAIDVTMSKHFGYAYQHEYRFAWVPTGSDGNLSHIDVEMGGLQDFAELIVL